MGKTIRIGAVQGEPAWNDLEAGVQKTMALIKEAGEKGINVLGFPELWIPGYPVAMWSKSYIENRQLFQVYRTNSIAVDSPEMRRIQQAVKEAGIFVVLGISERHGRTFYISQVFINPEGVIVNHRRKIKPTSVERTIWGDGSTEGLNVVVDGGEGYGKIGALCCAEHMMPLLRMHEYTSGVQIHVASWPTCWEIARVRGGGGDGNDDEDEYVTPSGEGDGKHDGVLGRWATRFLAREGRCFAVVATQVLRPESYARCGLPENCSIVKEAVGGGGHSMIFDPFGRPMVSSIAEDEEGILFADADLDLLIPAASMVDVAGNTARPDLLGLRLSRPAPLVTET